MEMSQGQSFIQTVLRALTRLPHRGTATEQETEAAQRLQTLLSNIGATVRTEPFQTPKTYATVLYWLIGGIVMGLALVPVTFVAIGFVWYFSLLAWRYFNGQYSFIFKFPVQHTAHNVVGHWPAQVRSEKAKKVILVAHYDTAPISHLYQANRQAFARTSLRILLGVIGLASIVAFGEAIHVGLPYIRFVRYILMIYLVWQAINRTIDHWRKGYSNGANDNASGVAAALATADRLRQVPDAEIDVVLTSAKEVGTLGAYYYVQSHQREWNRTQTLVINFDTLGAGKLTVVEQTGTLETIRFDNEPTRLAQQLLNTDAFRGRAQLGRWHVTNFDSVRFVQNRVPTLTLCALDRQGQMPHLHQPNDTVDHIDENTIDTAVDLAEAVIQKWVVSE